MGHVPIIDRTLAVSMYFTARGHSKSFLYSRFHLRVMNGQEMIYNLVIRKIDQGQFHLFVDEYTFQIEDHFYTDPKIIYCRHTLKYQLSWNN